MPDMNPYNFVRIRPLAEDARQPPLGHKKLVEEFEGQPVYSGRLQGRLTAFGPLMILSQYPEDVREENQHKHFQRFFHYPGDPRPIIPGTSLKGMVRAVAEAASNSCLSVLNDVYVKRWDNFSSAYPPSLNFCGRVEAPGVETTSGEAKQFCPTCRVFGTAAEEGAGTSTTGAYPRAFQGKVRFSDAVLEGDLNQIYGNPARLIILGEPKLSQQVWYHDPKRGSHKYPLAGRKFYYHHDILQPQTDNSNARLHLRATVTPLAPGATFTFHLDFRNLLRDELALLLYALELEPPASLVPADNDTITFNWRDVRNQNGVYHKLGYGKPAGLGSVCLLVTEMAFLDAASRYSGRGDGWRDRRGGQEVRTFVEQEKQRFRISQTFAKDEKRYYQPYLSDLRQLLRFPNGIRAFRYPILDEFKVYKENGIKLPLPGREREWEEM
jgi:hypothetical protein